MLNTWFDTKNGTWVIRLIHPGDATTSEYHLTKDQLTQLAMDESIVIEK